MINPFKINYSALSDVKLVDRVISGDNDAIVYFFYERFSATFQYHIYNVFSYYEDIQEPVDEFFLYMYEDNWRRLRTFDSSKSSLSTWISTVSLRFFIKYKFNKIDSRDVVAINDKWETLKSDWVECQNEGVMMDINNAITQIPGERDRKIAERFFLDDAAPDKIAEEFSLDIDYVYTVKNRIIKSLKQKLEDYSRL